MEVEKSVSMHLDAFERSHKLQIVTDTKLRYASQMFLLFKDILEMWLGKDFNKCVHHLQNFVGCKPWFVGLMDCCHQTAFISSTKSKEKKEKNCSI